MSYTAEVVADSPVAYWRLGDTSGTTAVCAPTTYNGTYNGTFTLNQTAGSIGDSDKCVLLDGSTAYVQVADNAALTPYVAGSMSLECLVKPTNLLLTAAGGWIIAKGGDATPTASRYDYALYVTASGQLTFTIWQGSTGGSTYQSLSSGPFILISDQWNHVVATFNATGTVMELWINGVKVGSINVTAGSRTRTTATLRFGRRSDDAANFFRGLIDEFALYNAVLSDARIAAHYAASGAYAGVLYGSVPTFYTAPVYTSLKQASPHGELPALHPSPICELHNLRSLYRYSTVRPYNVTNKTISGVVYELGVPVARRLALIDRMNGQTVAVTMSDAVTGAYAFKGLPDISNAFAVMAMDEYGSPLYNAQVYDWVTAG